MTTIDPTILLMVLMASRVFEVPAPLICAIVDVESGWNIHALGDYDAEARPHAFGLFQLHDQGAGYGYPQDLLLNPVFNVFRGTEYLKSNMDLFPNNLKLAISAMKQGPGGAAERGYGATRSYVTNILNLKKKYEEESREWLKKGTP